MAMLTKLLRWLGVSTFAIARQTIPVLTCVCFELRIRRRIKIEETTHELNDDMEQYVVLELDSLGSAHRLELERREQLRRNAQGNLAAITVAMSFIFGVIGIFGNSSIPAVDTSIVIAVRVCGAVAVLSFLMSAVSAMRALAPAKVYDMWLQARLRPCGRSSPEGDEKARLIKAVFLNQGYNLILANYADASNIGMRNGVVAVGAALLLMIAFGGSLW